MSVCLCVSAYARGAQDAVTLEFYFGLIVCGLTRNLYTVNE